jgi:enoyl-CoA hydratase
VITGEHGNRTVAHGARTLVSNRSVGQDASMTNSSPVEMTRPHEGIAQITLNRPARLNAMTAELVQGLHDTLNNVRTDPSVRVVVLTGAGRGFCAGLDLGGYGVAPDTDGLGPVQAGFAGQRHIASLIPHLRALPQPVIAAVNGPASGGGFALVLGSDIRIAAASARFNAAFVRIGLSACDIGTSWLLPRLVGAGRAHELMLTGRLFDAEEAARLGLVSEVVADDVLLDAAYDKAAEIMANSPFGVSLTKEAMWTALEIPGLQAAIDLENRQQVMASLTVDHREAMRAFLEKRPPTFTNG